MEEQLALQGEETIKTSQQSQDQIPHDPNSADKFPGGYTPVGEGVDNTPVETAPTNNVGEVEVTANIDLTNPTLESYGGSGDSINLGTTITPEEAFKAYGIDITPVKTNDISFNLDIIPPGAGDVIDDSVVADNLPEQEPPVEPPLPPVEPPTEPPVDPEEPDPEEPEEPDPEEPDPEEPEEPDPEEPEEPDPEEPDPGKGNPGNDKEVGNSPWDGETGASDNPGKGNHQDGQDPEPNQPPGDSKNDGGQNNDSENSPGNGGNGGKPENHQDNGWGNGDDDAPGNSGPHNNAENDATPSEHYDDFVGRFIEENPVDFSQSATYNWEYDNDDHLDYKDTFIDISNIPELPDVPHFADFNDA